MWNVDPAQNYEMKFEFCGRAATRISLQRKYIVVLLFEASKELNLVGWT